MGLQEKIDDLDKIGELPEFSCHMDNECYYDCLETWNEEVEEVFIKHSSNHIFSDAEGVRSK